MALLSRETGRISSADERDAAYADATQTAVASAASTAVAADPNRDLLDAIGTGQPTSSELAPAPDDGTRLYPSIAALLADPPSAGETVWVDAYHGEIIEYVDWLHDAPASGCPSASESVLLDKPFLHQLRAFHGITTSIPDAYHGPALIAAGLDTEGRITTHPVLPRRSRLVLHMGDPALAHCDDAERIVLVERVAHGFEAKPDWLAIHQAIRTSETVGWIEGATAPFGPDGEPSHGSGGYSIAVPKGLEATDLVGKSPMKPWRKAQSSLPDPVARLAQPTLPGHPILVRRYLPGWPGHEDRLRELSDPDRWLGNQFQRPSGPVHEAAARDHHLAFAVLSSELDDTSPEGFDYMTPHVIRAVTDASGVLYEFEVTLPKDYLLAQPLLWRLEAVLDRFVAPAAGDPTRSAATPSPTGLDQTVINDVDFAATSVDGVDGLAIVGGEEGVALLAIDPYGWPTSMRSYTPPSPATLGLVREADIDVVAQQVTGGDRDAARALLVGESSSWTAQAVAIRPPYAYAAIEWPAGSGLAWLHVLDASDRPGERFYRDVNDFVATVGAVRLDPGADAPIGHVRAHGVALAGDHLLVATSAGLFDVDIADPASPVVRPPGAGLQDVISAIAVAPDGSRAWACGGQLGDGAVTALDLTDPGALRIAGTHRTEYALLDCATDGTTLWATTGSETHDVARYAVANGGAPRPIDALRPAGGVAHTVELVGYRLVLGATDVEASAGSPHPAPAAPLAADRHGLLVYDVTRPDAPTELGVIPLPGAVHDLAMAGRFLLAAIGEHGVFVYGRRDGAP